MRTSLALLTLTATLALAACGAEPTETTAAPTTASSPSPVQPQSPSPEAEPADPQPEPAPEPPAEPAEPATAAVTIADFDYAPDPVEVAAGGTVTWTNDDSTAHTATVDGGGPDTGSISGGSSASLTFDDPGTYDYVCRFHPGSMTGTVVVQ